MTEKLFWIDSYQKEFTATIVEQFETAAGNAIILDRTCFYATSGGQPYDRGTLNSTPVTDVRLEQDRLIHLTRAPLQGEKVTGSIDWNRRFDHMQQHTGQHILSAAFDKLFRAETSAFHLGEEYCSIELNKPNLSNKQIQQAEDLANQVIHSATTVNCFLVDPQQAKQFPLRKQSDLSEALRLVQIGDFDISPCSGTHVKNAGEVGLVFVTGSEKVSQGIKVTFLCGNRIRNSYRKNSDVLKRLARSLTTSFDLLPEAVTRLQNQLKELRKDLFRMKEEKLKEKALELLKGAESWAGKRRIVRVFNRPYQECRFLAQKLSEYEEVVGAFASVPEKRVVFFKNRLLEFPLRPLFHLFLSQTSAKGGGPDHFLEAGGLQISDDLEGILRRIFDHG